MIHCLTHQRSITQNKRHWWRQLRTWAGLPPCPLPVPPALLPPPLPCLCCWDPVISAILLSICSRRSRMDILNWLSRVELGRVRWCSGSRASNTRPIQACRTAILDWHKLNQTTEVCQGQIYPAGSGHDTLHKTGASMVAQRNRKSLFVKVLVSGSWHPISLSNSPVETLKKSGREAPRADKLNRYNLI